MFMEFISFYKVSKFFKEFYIKFDVFEQFVNEFHMFKHNFTKICLSLSLDLIFRAPRPGNQAWTQKNMKKTKTKIRISHLNTSF